MLHLNTSFIIFHVACFIFVSCDWSRLQRRRQHRQRLCCRPSPPSPDGFRAGLQGTMQRVRREVHLAVSTNQWRRGSKWLVMLPVELFRAGFRGLRPTTKHVTMAKAEEQKANSMIGKNNNIWLVDTCEKLTYSPQ